MNHLFDGFTANLGPALLQLWPLWAFFGGIFLWQILLGRRAQRRLARAGMPAIDRMSGPEFERRLGVLFRALGYAVEHTGRPGDCGADLVIRQAGTATVVPAKRWSKNVGVAAVQQVVAAKAQYGCTAALVVTNRGFTAAARELARTNGVTLWDRTVLIERLLAGGTPAPTAVAVAVPARPAAAVPLAAAAPPPPPVPAPAAAAAAFPPRLAVPACPRCGAAMLLKTAGSGPNRGGQFWGCSTFPRCRAIVNVARGDA